MKILSYFKENEKTKVQYLLEGKWDWKSVHIPAYMSKLTRNQASIVFQGRTRMLKVKR